MSDAKIAFGVMVGRARRSWAAGPPETSAPSCAGPAAELTNAPCSSACFSVRAGGSSTARMLFGTVPRVRRTVHRLLTV